MAAALAHELNQPLTVIANYAEQCLSVLQSSEPTSPEVREAVERMLSSTQRATRIIRRIAKLARTTKPERTALPINDLVREVAELVDSAIQAGGMTIELHLGGELPLVAVDPIQIEQVLLNLVRNALDALVEIEPAQRTLTIITRRTTENMVEVAVQDTGPGVPSEATEHIFEPYVSTKPDGLGLGLAISRSIIEAHGGRLWAVPDGGRGAMFRFTVPVARESD